MQKYYVESEHEGGLLAASCNVTGKRVLLWRTLVAQPESFAETIEDYRRDPPMLALKIIEVVREEDDTFIAVFDWADPLREVFGSLQAIVVCDVFLQATQLFKKKGELKGVPLLQESELRVCWLSESTEMAVLPAPQRKANRLAVLTQEEKVWNVGVWFASLLVSLSSKIKDADYRYRELMRSLETESRARRPLSDLHCLTKNMLKLLPCQRISMKMVEHSLHLIKAKFEKRDSGSSLLLQSNIKSTSNFFSKNRPESKSFVSELLSSHPHPKLLSTVNSNNRQTHSFFHAKSTSSSTKKFTTGLLTYASSQISKPLTTSQNRKSLPSHSLFARIPPKKDNFMDPSLMFRRLREYEHNRFNRQIQHLEKLRLQKRAEEPAKLARRPSSRRSILTNSKRDSSQEPENVLPKVPLQLEDSLVCSSNRRSRKVLPIDSMSPLKTITRVSSSKGCRISSHTSKQSTDPCLQEIILENIKENVCPQQQSQAKLKGACGSRPVSSEKHELEEIHVSPPLVQQNQQIPRLVVHPPPQSSNKTSALRPSIQSHIPPQAFQPAKIDSQLLAQSETQPKELIKLYNILGAAVKHANTNLKSEMHTWSVPCFLIYKSYSYLRKSFVVSFECSLKPKLLETLHTQNSSIDSGVAAMLNILKNSTQIVEEYRSIMTEPFTDTFRKDVVPVLHKNYLMQESNLRKYRLSLLQNDLFKDMLKHCCLLGLSLIIIDHEELFRGGLNLQSVYAALLERLDSTQAEDLNVDNILQEISFKIERIMKRY